MIGLIAPILTFAASLYYLSRSKHLDSILLITGSSINLLTSILFIYLPYYVQSRALTSSAMTTYFAIGGIVSLVGTLIFVAGLLLLINRFLQLELKSSEKIK